MNSLNPANQKLMLAIRAAKSDAKVTSDESAILSEAIVALTRYPKPVNSYEQARKLIGFEGPTLAAISHILPAPAASAGANGVAQAVVDLCSQERWSPKKAQAAALTSPATVSIASPSSASRRRTGGPTAVKNRATASSDVIREGAAVNGLLEPEAEDDATYADGAFVLDDVGNAVKPAVSKRKRLGSKSAKDSVAPAAAVPNADVPSISAELPPAASVVRSLSAATSVSAAMPALSRNSSLASAKPAVSSGDDSSWQCPDCSRGFEFDADEQRWRVRAPPTVGTFASAAGRTRIACPLGYQLPHQCQVSVPLGAAAATKMAASAASGGHGLDDWEVVLLLDTREVAFSMSFIARLVIFLCEVLQVRSRRDREYIARQLAGRGVPVEARMLPLGDMLWVARRRAVGGAAAAPPASSTFGGVVHPGVNQSAIPVSEPSIIGRGYGAVATLAASAAAAAASQAETSAKAAGKKRKRESDSAGRDVPADTAGLGSDEYVLNFIAERKAVDDLAMSLKDGRYGEQKARLGATGQRVTYILEGDPNKMATSFNSNVLAPHLAGRVPAITPAHIKSAAVSTQVSIYLLRFEPSLTRCRADYQRLPCRVDSHRGRHRYLADHIPRLHLTRVGGGRRLPGGVGSRGCRPPVRPRYQPEPAEGPAARTALAARQAEAAKRREQVYQRRCGSVGSSDRPG